MATPESWYGEAERLRRTFLDPVERGYDFTIELRPREFCDHGLRDKEHCDVCCVDIGDAARSMMLEGLFG